MKKIYKLIYILILTIGSILILSCGGGDNDNPTLSQTDITKQTNTQDKTTDGDPNRSIIPEPKPIPDTITNDRPITYERGSKGGTLILGDYSGDPKTFNIIVATEGVSLNIIRRFQMSLMHYDEDTGSWEVYPGNKQKGSTGKGYDLEVTEDGRQIMTIYLRKDVYWSDGVRMTAMDWVWFWNNVFTDQYISPGGYSQALLLMEDGEESLVKAEYENDFEFRLIFPRVLGEPELLADFSTMPRHIIESIYNSSNSQAIFTMWGVNTPVDQLVGNGAWRLIKYQQNESIIFEANPTFFKRDEWGTPLPYLDRLMINLVPDTNTLHLKFIGKEVDTYYIQNADFKEIISKAEKEDYSVWNGGLSPEMEFIVFNQNPDSKRLKENPKLNWFTKKEFRQALSYLIDRETLSIQIYNGLAEPDSTYLAKASPYYDSNVQFDNAYDPKKALEVLENIGIRDRNGDGIMEDLDKNEIRFELNTNSGNQEREKTINSIANEWKTYGIIAFPATIEFKVMVNRLTSSYDWDCALISLEGGLFPLNDSLYMSNGNIHMWNPLQESPNTEWEAEVDHLHRLAKYEPDFKRRKAIINDMFSLLYEQVPMIPLVRKYTFRAVYNKWENVNWDIWTEVGGYNNMRVFKK